jgi:hypothetical protein
LTLRFRGLPPLPEPAPAVTTAPVSRREQIVTWAFIGACTLVFLFLIFMFTGWLR